MLLFHTLGVGFNLQVRCQLIKIKVYTGFSREWLYMDNAKRQKDREKSRRPLGPKRIIGLLL